MHGDLIHLKGDDRQIEASIVAEQNIFLNLHVRCPEKVPKKSPKWWALMLIYHGGIRKKHQSHQIQALDGQS